MTPEKMTDEELDTFRRIASGEDESWDDRWRGWMAKGAAHIAALAAERDEARRRTWVQCTTVSNECLGGCRSMAEHDRYRQRALMTEVENLRPFEALHEDMTRLKRETEQEVATLRERVRALEAEAARSREANHCAKRDLGARALAAESRLSGILQRAGDEGALVRVAITADPLDRAATRAHEQAVAVARYVVGEDGAGAHDALVLPSGAALDVPPGFRLDPAPTTTEAFATVRAVLYPNIPGALPEATAALSRLERRMGAMGRAVRLVLETDEWWRTSQDSRAESVRAALTDAPAVYTAEEVELAMAPVTAATNDNVPLVESVKRAIRENLAALRRQLPR